MPNTLVASPPPLFLRSLSADGRSCTPDRRREIKLGALESRGDGKYFCLIHRNPALPTDFTIPDSARAPSPQYSSNTRPLSAPASSVVRAPLTRGTKEAKVEQEDKYPDIIYAIFGEYARRPDFPLLNDVAEVCGVIIAGLGTQANTKAVQFTVINLSIKDWTALSKVFEKHKEFHQVK